MSIIIIMVANTSAGQQLVVRDLIGVVGHIIAITITIIGEIN